MRLQSRILHPEALQQPKARAAGADGKLRIQGQDHELFNAIPLDLSHRFFGKGVPVPHSNVDADVFAFLGQGRFEGISLLLGDMAQGRATANLLVIFLGLLSPRARKLTRPGGAAARGMAGE